MVGEDDAQQQVGTRKRARSPAYPAIGLAEAVEKAEDIRAKEGRNATNVDTALGHWGHMPKSGSGMVALSALIKHGLLEGEGRGDERRVKLTALAQKILLDQRPESTERLAAIREAALLPPIYSGIWEKYQGALPSDATIRYHLRGDRNFMDEAADACIKNLKATLAYARLPESDSVSVEAEDISRPEWEPQMTLPSTLVKPETAAPEEPGVKSVMRTLQIPLTDAPWVMIQVPYPMTELDWGELRAWLDSNASPLTKGAVKPQQP